MSSRWTTSAYGENKSRDAERKQQKEAKRLAREQRQAQIDIPHNRSKSARPLKRQRIDSDAKNDLDGSVSGTALPQSCSTISSYTILNPIEEGSYGSVSRARHNRTSRIVALKKIKLLPQAIAHEGFPITALREIQCLRDCQHDNIVELVEVITGDGAGSTQDIYVVLEFAQHDLKSILSTIENPFNPSEIKTLMHQLVDAVDYLHQNWIIHRDLKTSNLLFTSTGRLLLADFGMARYTSKPAPRLTQLVTTLWYRAPELLLGAEEYAFEIDVWGLGCVMAELCGKTGEPLFMGKNEVAQISEMFEVLGAPDDDEWPGLRNLPNTHIVASLTGVSRVSLLAEKDFPGCSSAGFRLIKDMLSLNCEKRPTADEVLSHRYFRETPRRAAKELMPTFPSKAGGERRKAWSPPAPLRQVETHESSGDA